MHQETILKLWNSIRNDSYLYLFLTQDNIVIDDCTKSKTI